VTVVVADGRQARSAATRERILLAAREEFQRLGFAGGRIDAIADAAAANKRMIYAYYGSKADLFAAVLADNVGRVAAAVDFTPEDLPGYAVGLYDFWRSDVTSLRLFSWRNVEASTVPDFEDATYREMIGAIARTPAARRSGIPDDHLLAFVFAIVLAWAIPAAVFQVSDADEEERRRDSIRVAVENMVRARS
jgi:AcrR family transcriptional regulator